MSPKVLIITGMHRSGTSVITQWLRRCGLPVGERLEPAGIGNADGHFEDADFLEIHQQFLKARKIPSSGFTSSPFRSLTPLEKEPLVSLLVEKNDQHEQWGWKEPRTCLFLDVYKELIPSAFYLVVVRDYKATVNSMLQREYATHSRKLRSKKGLSKLKWLLFKNKSRQQLSRKYAGEYLEIWIHYYECIMTHILSLPPEKYMFIRFTFLVGNDKRVFSCLKDEWQFSLDYSPFASVFKQSLLSEVEDIEQYIRNKTLLEKAKKIDRLIAQMLDE
ncbi:MAG: hypothetical protein E6H09_08190 [Bacteroidetes bacterium]|nr:MAG: hypothetical protein E6H09_08190 [Bacteroidota bacterium]